MGGKIVAMPLPIIQSWAEPSDLMRLFDKTDFQMAQQLGDEEQMAWGAAFANPALRGVENANHVRDAVVPAGMTAEGVAGEVDRYFAGRGTRCAYWTVKRSADAGALVEHLKRARYEEVRTDVMYLRGAPRGVVKEVGGLTIIPARASYRHARDLAEEVARERGVADVPQAVEAHMMRLDDPQWDPILAIQDGRAVGRAYVLTVGDVGRVEFVYVVRDLRGRGIGRTLMSRALEVCARSTFRHVFLTCDAANVPAVRLYGKLGFEKIGEAVRYRAPG